MPLTKENRFSSLFTENDILVLQRYFELNKKYHILINEQIAKDLSNHPLWGSILKMQTPTQQKEQNERSYELQRAAIFDGKWDEYSTPLKMQGAFYAQLNIDYSDWYEIIKMYKDYLIPHIKKDFTDSSIDAIDFLDGLSKLVDYAMYVIAEAYFEEKNSFLTVLEKSLNEIYIFDTETFKFKYTNEGARLNLGYSDSELKKLTPIDIKPEFTQLHFKQLIAPLINNEKEKVIFIAKHERKDGSLYPVEVHLQLVNRAVNTMFFSIVLDITERTEANEIILQANERFEKVTEATKDAIWDWNIENQTYYRSKAIENFFGKKVSKQMKTMDFWTDSFHPDDLSNVQNSLNEAISDSTCNRWESEYRIFNEKGETLYVIDRSVIIRNKSGKAIRMVGAMSDITAQKKLETQLKEHAVELEKSNEELEQFAYVASHDLQEPLRMVTSFMDQLKRKYQDQLDGKALSYIHYATDGAKRMKQIIQDVLDYSKSGKLADTQVSIDLNEILTGYKILRNKIIEEKNVLIKSDILPIVKGFKSPITQTIHCLLDNAIKYSKEGIQPIIRISVTENEDEWIVCVTDNGIGIDEKFFDKIFVIFQRLHSKDQFSGTGIGLAIAKKNIESCHGRMWVESVLNEGSSFYFTLNKIKL